MILHKFLRMCSAAFLMAFWTWGSPIYAQSLLQDFEDLFERCRASVETDSAFDTGSLQRRDVPEHHARDWGMCSTQEAWASPGSGLYVLRKEWTSRDGTVRHLCDIRLINEERVLEAGEQALLLRHFLVRQTELIGAGTQEIDRRLSPIPPIVNAAFLMLDRNSNGRKVSNNMSFLPDGTFFSAGSGEQTVRACETE